MLHHTNPDYLVIADFTPKIDYVLIFRKVTEDFVVAHWPCFEKGSPDTITSWGEGHYFGDIIDAVDFIKTVMAEEAELLEELDSTEEDYAENRPCDNSGYCSSSCPDYYRCAGKN